MKANSKHASVPLSFERRAIIASASVTKEKNTIHSLTAIDVTEPRRLMKEFTGRTGEKLSFTAYIVTCLARVINDHPKLNSFIKGRRLILLDDVTVSVLVEREIDGEKVPEPVGIQSAQSKTLRQIHSEIRQAQNRTKETLGSLSGQKWFHFIPGSLLKMFIRIADSNISMAQRYGKIGVTAVGMYCKEAIWFIPHGSTTVLITVGSIGPKMVEMEGKIITRDHLSLTASFDHNIVDGAPAARFMTQFIELLKSGAPIQEEISRVTFRTQRNPTIPEIR